MLPQPKKLNLRRVIFLIAIAIIGAVIVFAIFNHAGWLELIRLAREMAD